LSSLFIATITLLLLPQLPIPLVDIGCYPVFEKTNSSKNDKEIVFVSDTQEPIWIETFLLDRNNNEQARDLIFNEIIKKKPNKVIHLGDIVAFGYKDDSWKPIDNYLKKFLENDIQFYPTLGNHELLLFSDAGEKQFQKRFPFYSRTGYSINNGETEIILLNSNFSNMTNSEIEQQQKWYKNKLDLLENDSTISVVIVGTHHSPFTNSTIVSPDKDVQKLFVTPFLKSKKGKLFISGHCHAFEHFKHEGKDFLVVGGGGGLQQPLLVGNKSRWNDRYNNSTPKRMFHFLKLKNKHDTLFVELNVLQKDFLKFNKNYQIKIPLLPAK
jgi:hypothetical protein